MFDVNDQNHHKPTRLNKGPQMTPRLEYTLCFLGEQGTVRLDQLQRLLARLSPNPEKLKDGTMLSTARTQKFLKRWAAEGLFEYKVFRLHEPAWFWLTQRGLKYVNLNLRYYEPSPSMLAHIYAVNNIRLLIEARRPTVTWRSERQLRAEQHAREKNVSIKHLPDAELLLDGGQSRIAIEVELTAKSESRLQDILYDLAANKRYTAIWYFAPESVSQTVQHALVKLPPDHRKRFAIYDLEGRVHTS